MEAAFVEIGLEKNGFLYVDEIVGPELEGRQGARKIQDLIQRGQTVLVQAVKDPMKTKGARLTTEISLPGRFVVYVPHGDGLGVSRRLDDDERNRLEGDPQGDRAEDGRRDRPHRRRGRVGRGHRARPRLPAAALEDDRGAARRRRRRRRSSTRRPSCRCASSRDLFTGDFERLLVDHDRTYKRIVGYLKKTSPHMVERVTRYKEREPLLEAFGVEQEIQSTLNRRVDLPSGGYLIFDYAEAFTVIDVNTGRFVGSRSKKRARGSRTRSRRTTSRRSRRSSASSGCATSAGSSSSTSSTWRTRRTAQQVEEALRQELERDRTKTYVVEISPLGLVEMTRQNVTDGPREVMTRKCPTCGGDGIVVSEQTAAVDVERRLRALVTPGSRAKAFKVELNAKVAALVAGPGGSRLRELEETTKRRFFFVGIEDVHLDHFRVLEQGTVEKLAPAAAGRRRPGARAQARRGRAARRRTPASARSTGVEVVVADAAKLVGKKVDGARSPPSMEGVA